MHGFAYRLCAPKACSMPAHVQTFPSRIPLPTLSSPRSSQPVAAAGYCSAWCWDVEVLEWCWGTTCSGWVREASERQQGEGRAGAGRQGGSKARAGGQGAAGGSPKIHNMAVAVLSDECGSGCHVHTACTACVWQRGWTALGWTPELQAHGSLPPSTHPMLHMCKEFSLTGLYYFALSPPCTIGAWL